MKVAVYFATGYEEVEALAVIDVLRRAQIETLMVGVESDMVTSARGVQIKMDTTIQALQSNEIDMMVLPGGIPGVIHLEESAMLMNQLKQFKEEHKWLAAICAAPSILGKLGLLEGEKGTCYPNYESQLLGCDVVNEAVVVSNRIVTAKGAGVSLEFGLKLVEVLKGRELADEIRKGMLVGLY